MTVYVESNFVLELALKQPEHESCEAILELAERGSLRLVLPAFCIGEPYEAMVRRDSKRREAYRRLHEELRELSRSASYADSAAKLGGLTNWLVGTGKEEMDRLNNVLVRLLDAATLIPIDKDVLADALAAQRDLDMSPQDSIVYASVRSQVMQATELQCFLNKNAKDFALSKIEEELLAHNCKLITRFSDGLAYIRSILGWSKQNEGL